MKKGRITACLLAAILLLSGCQGSNQKVPNNANDVTDNTEYRVANLTPANDYYGYINAETLMSLELEPGKNYAGVTVDMLNKSNEQVDAIIDEIVSSDEDYPKGSNEQIIRDAYNQMIAFYQGDEEQDKIDEAIVTGLIERTNEIESMNELIDYWCVLSRDYMINAPIDGGVQQDVYDSSRNVLILSTFVPIDMEKMLSSSINAGVQRDNIKAILCLSGMDEPTAREKSNNIIFMFSSIAGKCEFKDEDEEDKKDHISYFVYYSKDEVSKNLKNISYEKLCQMMGFEDKIPDELSIPNTDQVYAIEETFDDEHLQEWKDCTIIQILSDTTGFYPKKYNSAEFNPLKADEYAKKTLKTVMKEELSEIFASKYEDERKVKLATDICNDLKDEYYNLIDEADWMSDEGKAYCREKLDNMIFYIGSQEHHEIDESDGNIIGDTIYQTALNYSKRTRIESKQTLFEPATRNGFESMPAITVNACYVPTMNCIVIPTAYMADENLNLNESYEWNLGHLGSTIGHEISHGFDSYGIKYDKLGNYVPEAMPQADRDAFEDLQEKAIEYYNSFTFFGSHINGKNTLGENFADISGLQACLEIAKTPDKQKLVLEAYADKYCNIYTDEWLKNQIADNEHSPDNIRVNAVVALFDCYYEIYDVKEGDPMYIAPENRIRRW